jgi:hypothetical protein
MASRWLLQSDFTTGELDPRGIGRQDLERYPSAVALARNVSIDKLGALHVRGGLRWVDDVPAGDRVQLRGWERGDDDYLIAIGEGSNLYLYDSTDALVATLEGDSQDGYVISALIRNQVSPGATASGQVQQHANTGAAGGQANLFGRISPPLGGSANPKWDWGETRACAMVSVLVSGGGELTFAVDEDTFHDQNTVASPWNISHDFSSDANLCLVLISGELSSASPVTAVAIDPAGDNIALAQLRKAVQGATQFCELWGVYDFTAQSSATTVRVTFAGNAAGSAEVITFIGASRLPLQQEVASAAREGFGISVELSVPDGGFGETSVGAVDTASDSKSILFFHEDVETHWLHFTEADGWTFEQYPIEVYPYHRFQAPGVTLDPSGLSGGITLTTSAAHWLPSHVGSIVRYGTANDRIEVTGFTSSTVVDATVLDTLPAHTPTAEWDEQVWSAGRGWPVSGCWHQGRLAIGGARDLRDGFWVSKIGENVAEEEGVSFELGEEDDDAIWTRIRADEGVNIEYVRSQGPLLILASGTEWIVPQQPLTPTNISFDRQASQGVDRLKPADLDGAIIYLRAARAGMDEEGEQNLVHFAWDELSQRYRPSDISVLNQHLLRNPIDMAAARGSTSDANNILYLTNDDGTVAALHLPTIDRPGMTLFDGEIEPYSVAVSAGRLYCAAEFNGAHRIFRLDPDSCMDASASFELESASTSVGTFAWLADQEVTVKGLTASGWTIQTATADGSGAVTVATAVEKGEVGIPFEWKIRRLPLEAGPATVGSLKSPVEARVLVKDTLAIEIGDEDGRSAMTLEDGSTLGDLTTDPATPYSGHLRDHLMGGWAEDALIEVGGTAPWPATVLVFNVKVEF